MRMGPEVKLIFDLPTGCRVAQFVDLMCFVQALCTRFGPIHMVVCRYELWFLAKAVHYVPEHFLKFWEVYLRMLKSNVFNVSVFDKC